MKQKKTILFFYTSNRRTVAIETLILELRKKDYEVLLLTTSPHGHLHQFLNSQGISTYTFTGGYFKQILFLIKFCKHHKVHVVFSHLQQANFVSVIARFFMTSKVIAFRHHLQFIYQTDEKIQVNRNEILMDKIINRLAKKIVVPSTGVYEGMKTHEHVNMSNVSIIPYIYDFSKYETPDPDLVESIKNQYPCTLRLIMVSRMIRLKRHHVVFPVIKDLVDQGFNIKLLVLDQGPEKENLERYVRDNKLESVIFFLGYRTDFVNYMAASDLLIQPSLTDASNSAAKEMALFEKPVAVSSNVGDYSDYVVNNQNGYLIPVSDTSKHLKEIIIDAYNHPDKLKSMGKMLKKDVISRFDQSNSKQIMALYESLLK